MAPDDSPASAKEDRPTPVEPVPAVVATAAEAPTPKPVLTVEELVSLLRTYADSFSGVWTELTRLRERQDEFAREAQRAPLGAAAIVSSARPGRDRLLILSIILNAVALGFFAASLLVRQ